jgi:hypothetical protein
VPALWTFGKRTFRDRSASFPFAADSIYPSRKMTPHAQELAMLKEFLSIFNNTPATLRKYKRNQLIAGGIAIGLILISLLGGSIGILEPREAIVAALFGGMSAGVSFLDRCSVQQIPFFIRYTSADITSIRARIREIEDSIKK